MTKAFFVEQFESTMEAVGDVLRKALRALTERGWIAPGQTFYAQLCLEEALVNAVDHGNHCDPEKSVRLEMSEDGDVCIIRVFDEGGGFSPDDIQLPQSEQANGRGICLIRHCMEKVAYRKDCRCLEMQLRRAAPDQKGCVQ